MRFTLDTNSATVSIDDYWKFCIGSCHAATALRDDYRQMLKQCRQELGFKYLRFHGLFNDDMSVLRKSLTGEYVMSFSNIDNIFDFLLSIGMKPFVEIGFMPECLKSADEYIFHYKGNVTPPHDEAVWINLIDSFIKHIISRYGRDEVRKWYFEIWNEPNLGKETGFKGGRFWSGTMEDYFRLYTITVNTIKSIDDKLQVGGPATSNNAWIPQMLDYCEKSNTKIDFVTTHHYPTDIVLGYGVEDSQNFVNAFNNTDSSDKGKLSQIINDYLTFQQDIWKKVDRGVLTDMAKRAKSECRGLPLYYTEWSSLAGLESDGAFGASFIAKTIQDNAGLVKGYSYWTFSDIFEEKGMPNCAFHGGFGLMNMNGIKKAPYNAFALLNKLGDERYDTQFSSGTVDIYCYRDSSSSAVQLLMVNHQSLLHDIEEQDITVNTEGSEFLAEFDVYRVDENHANPLKLWYDMNMPQYLKDYEIMALKAESELKRETHLLQNNTVNITLPKQGIALVTLYEK